MMPHAKFGPDLLKTVDVHKEQINMQKFSVLYINKTQVSSKNVTQISND